jgi:hypothetical protein
VSERPRIALLEHDRRGAAAPLLADLTGQGVDVEPVHPVELPDAPFSLRKIGDAPGRMPGTLLALWRGGYDMAHAFTAQDAAVALAWSRLGGGLAVYTQREPLTRASVADRRLRLTLLRLALERSAAVIAPDEATAESLRRWMAVDPLVLDAGSGAEHLALYARLGPR